MAIAIATLKTEILTQMTAVGFDVTNEYSWANKFAEALATAIVNEFTANSGYNTHVHSDPQGGSTGPPVPTPQ